MSHASRRAVGVFAPAASLATALIAALLAMLAVGSPAVAAAPDSAEPVRTCAYDSHHFVVKLADDAIERGPPMRGCGDIETLKPNAGDCWSHVASARPEGATTTLDYTYNDPTQLVRLAGPASTTQRPAVGAPAEPSSLQQPRVAAKGATSLADEASGLLGSADDIVVLGRQADTAVAKGWNGHVVLDTPKWSMELNDAFIQGAIQQRQTIYLASPTKGNLVQTSGAYAGQPTVYARELQMLRDAGYTRSGDYMVPR